MGDSIRVGGLYVDAGRTGADISGACFSADPDGAPPYFRSDSPGRTNGSGARSGRSDRADLSDRSPRSGRAFRDGAAEAWISLGASDSGSAASFTWVSMNSWLSVGVAATLLPPRTPRRRRRPRQRFVPASSVSEEASASCVVSLGVAHYASLGSAGISLVV